MIYLILLIMCARPLLDSMCEMYIQSFKLMQHCTPVFPVDHNWGELHVNGCEFESLFQVHRELLVQVNYGKNLELLNTPWIYYSGCRNAHVINNVDWQGECTPSFVLSTMHEQSLIQDIKRLGSGYRTALRYAEAVCSKCMKSSDQACYYLVVCRQFPACELAKHSKHVKHRANWIF